MRHHLSCLAIACCAASMSAPVAAVPAVDAVFAFGDSLTDLHNGFDRSGYPPNPLGTDGRASNGPLAIERLVLDLQLDPAHALFDFAVGGATTGVTGVLAQVDAFRSSLGGRPADPDGLYFVWAGGNDLLAQPALADAAVLPAVQNLETAVRRLYALGARLFELPLLPDLAGIPALRGASQSLRTDVAAATNRFDDELATRLAGLPAELPGARIVVVDTRTVQANLLADPVIAITDTTHPCYVNATTICADPEHHLFWDDTHPTTVVHSYWGDAFAAAVPEPATWALWLVGGLAIASQLRRKDHGVRSCLLPG
jgi:phospholipase/lecithinase/hemolysin